MLQFRDVLASIIFSVCRRSGSLQLLCEGLKLIRAASPESVGVQVFMCPQYCTITLKPRPWQWHIVACFGDKSRGVSKEIEHVQFLN